MALPRSEIISAIYISLVQILLGFFGGGGVGRRCCCMNPHWKLPPAISASRRSYPLSAEQERKVSTDPTMRGAVVAAVSFLGGYLQMSQCVRDQLIGVRTRLYRKFHLPF